MPETAYYINLKSFSLTRLQKQLKDTRLLPSQQVLQENIDERFDCLAKQDIENLEQLQVVLKAKKDVEAFAEVTGLPLDFLTVLRREVNSYQPKPIALKDFPGVDPAVIQKLEGAGIKNTRQLFPHVLTQKDREAFAQQHQIEGEDLLELTKLTDAARMKWVGPKFARLLIETEYDTVEKVANANYEDLHAALMRVNQEKDIYGGQLGLEDMNLWVKVVQDVPQVINY